MLKTERCNGDDGMVWRSGLFDHEISLLTPGSVVMGNVYGLGWVVLKRSVIKEQLNFVLEKKRLISGFEEAPGKWYNIQPAAKCMQFKELVKMPPSEKELFAVYPGHRYMKYQTNKAANKAIVKNFPVMHGLFEQDAILLSDYMKKLFSVKFNFISAGCNFLINNGGVGDQIVHSDFDGSQFNS